MWYMVENGANVNVRMFDGRTALHLSAFSGKPKIVKVLLVNGANINAQDRSGETPLHAVVRLGNFFNFRI